MEIEAYSWDTGQVLLVALTNPANQGCPGKQTQQQTEGNTHSRPCENRRGITVGKSSIQVLSVVFKPRV